MHNINTLQNFEDVVHLLQAMQREIEEGKEKYSKDIKNLNRQINRLQHKVTRLETLNSSLMKEKNLQLIHDYGSKLLDLMDKNELEAFKKILTDHDYPVDEFIPKSSYNHLTLLHYAIEFGHFDFAHFLIEHGADVNIPEKKDLWTPLMFAIQKQREDLVRLIIEHEGNLDVRDVDGFSPLAVAVDTQNKDIIRLILSYKPNINNRREVITMTSPYKDKEIVAMIKEYFDVELNHK